MTHIFIKKDTKRIKKDSKLKYYMALLTAEGLPRFIFLDYTIDECKNKLWGIIMQPIKPIKDFNEFYGIMGTKIPFIIKTTSGFVLTKVMKKHTAMVNTKNPKICSILLNW